MEQKWNIKSFYGPLDGVSLRILGVLLAGMIRVQSKYSVSISDQITDEVIIGIAKPHGAVRYTASGSDKRGIFNWFQPAIIG